VDDNIKTKLLSAYLSNKKIMIVDSITPSRLRLAKTMSELGAPMTTIKMFGKYEEAVTYIENVVPDVVLSSFSFAGGSGFDFFHEFRQRFPDGKSILILVTSNMSQAAVAKAAEEDVDGYIIKPFTLNKLKEIITTAIMSKIAPTEYDRHIQGGKYLLAEKKFEEALNIFESSINLNPSPSLGHFYVGKTQKELNDEEEAIRHYTEGLKHCEFHFKCLEGLYELHSNKKRLHEAYEVLKSLVKFFPESNDRLLAVVRLAITTENYKDMEQWYDIFTKLEIRSETLIKYICAGLFVSARYYLMKNQTDKASDLLRKIIVSGTLLDQYDEKVKSLLLEYNISPEVLVR
jgi:DNA-binding NarL/FixJ family response regulator